MIGGGWLVNPDVETGAGDLFGLQRIGQRRLVVDAAARRGDEVAGAITGLSVAFGSG